MNALSSDSRSTSTLRVLLDARVVKRERTGVERYVTELAAHVACEAGCEVTLLCRSDEQAELVRELTGGSLPCQIARSPLADCGRGGVRGSHFSAFDVLHCPTPLFPFLRKPADVRVVCTVHDVTPRIDPRWHKRSHVAYFRWALPWFFRHVDQYLADSQATAADLARLYHVADARVTVVPLASRWPVEPAADPKRDFLLAVGTLEPRKNLARTVAAFQRVKQAHPQLKTELLLIGKGGWGDVRWGEMRWGEMRQSDDRQGVPDVRWTGFVDDDTLRALYREARGLVYPSLYEGFGLPVLEAMSLGCPVITSSCSSLPEVAGDAALLVDPHSVEAIAQAIQRLLTDEPHARRLADEGTRRATQFSWRRTARETLAVYRQVAGLD